jgi:hypothetical protein
MKRMGETIRGYYWLPAGDTLSDQLDRLTFTAANVVIVPHQLINITPIDELHRHKIKLCVDWTVFAGAGVRQAFPDSVPVEASGEPFTREEWYLPACPNHPYLRAHHLTTLAQTLQHWGNALDGLWLDFIRYPVRWEGKSPRLPQTCFCRNCLNLFLETDQTHYAIEETRELAHQILQHRAEEWVAWKCRRIVQFVQEVKAVLSAQPHPLRLGLFALPWRRTDFNGAIRTIAGQDLGQLAQIVDVISPMVYHKLCYQPVEWITEVVQDVYDWTRHPVLPVVQSLDQPELMSADEMQAALVNAFKRPSTGAMIFTLDPVVASAAKANAVHTQFSTSRPLSLCENFAGETA